MKQSTLTVAMGLVLGGAAFNAQAALTSTSVLAFDNGNVGNFTSAAGAGASYFTFVVDTEGTLLYTGLQKGTDGGIHIGTAQTTGSWNSTTSSCSPSGAACSHAGVPNDDPASPKYGMGYTTDHGPIDLGWNFYGNTGLHFTSTPINVVDNDVNSNGGFTKTLDFSGWRITWNGGPTWDLGGGDQVIVGKTGNTTINNGSGLATITCSTASCSATSSWTLDYAAVIPAGAATGFDSVPYSLHLEYAASVVPVPAAAWLFGSGLLGLAGMARRRRSS